MSKRFFTAFILTIFLTFCQTAHTGILDKQVVLYMPNHSKVKVLVSIFTDKVTHIWDKYAWAELDARQRSYYQNLYELQKEKIEKRKNKKERFRK